MQPIEIDFDKWYAEVEELGVDIDFSTEVGFPYIQTKLSEVLVKAEKAVQLSMRAARMLNRLVGEEASQRALYNITRLEVHLLEADRAKAMTTDLKCFIEVLKMRSTRLRALPGELRMYVQAMEDELQLERIRPKVGRSKLKDIEAPATLLPSDPVRAEELGDLFS